MAKEHLTQIIQKIENEDTRWDAIIELKMLNNPLITGELIHYLQHKNWIVRWCIAEKLGDLGETVAINPLIECLADSDFHVKKNAAKALSKYGPSIFKDLIRLLDHKNVHIRRLIHAIFAYNGSKGLVTLEQLIPKSNWVIANQIGYSIARIAQEEKEPIFLRLLSQQKVQKQAIMLLGEQQSMPAIPYLIQLYFTPPLKRCVLESFHRIGYEKVYPGVMKAWLSKKPRIQSDAEKLILKFGKTMIPAILQLCLKKHPPVIIQAAIRLIEKLNPIDFGNTIHQVAKQNVIFKNNATTLLQKYPTKKTPVSKKKFLGIL